MSLRANRIRVRTSKLMRSWHCARHARIGIATQTPRSLSKKKIVAEARTAKIKEMDLSYIRSMVLNRHFMYRNKYQGNTERAEREYVLLIHPNLTCIDERNNMPILWYISYMLRIEFKVPRWGQQNRISAFPYLWSVEMKRMQYSTCLRCSNMVKNPAERDREKTVGNHLINDRVELWVYNSGSKSSAVPRQCHDEQCHNIVLQPLDWKAMAEIHVWNCSKTLQQNTVSQYYL